MTASVGSLPRCLSRPSQTSDPWGRYYTSPLVSRSLIDGIEAPQPKLLLELGSGSGSLSSAAANRWQDAKLVTVDVDCRAPRRLDASDTTPRLKHTHFVHDVLDEALSDRIGLKLGTVDVAVCNPPYIRPRWRSDFGKILEDAGLSGALLSLFDAGADLLFLAQNLRLLRNNGKLGLILPDGLVTAERFSRVRQTLLRQHFVQQVVQLPRGVFKGTEAQTYLAVLTKSAGETGEVSLKQMGTDGRLSAAIHVGQDAAVKRLDYAFHAASQVSAHRSCESPLPTSFRQVLTAVVRGSICSSAIPSFPKPVFHLGDFAKPMGEQAVRIVPRRFALDARTAQRVAHDARLAVPGDILVARVGRSLADQVALVVHGPCVISDCIFALRAADDHREKLYRFLESEMGRLALGSAAHGVAARFMSKSNLFDIHF
ncbi:N5-glutamine S-adenosyl-L-methionine-dependent methyltransferase [Variovorax sp. SRS16]|uniref:N-6 DNA methylase n=1 Tax=Variovorax sp. SRS16 TaxID=282217 RepID=UPI00131935D8|nr:N-6 DNA methylase [Variovorax sp. SRS16]VTU29256.1 N5-glutamine S-adenosyl-L-methionine-dependent methyltransferase [Variovorax sp. SRS16]